MNRDKNMQTTEEIQEVLSSPEFPVNFAILILARSHRTLAANLLREVGLYPGQEFMLMQLWQKDNQSQNSLGKPFCLDHSTVAKSVRRLEDSGLVTRSRSKEDKRVTIVSLTQAGRDLKEKVLDAWSRLETITTDGLTEQEKTLFINLVRKIVSKADSSFEL